MFFPFLVVMPGLIALSVHGGLIPVKLHEGTGAIVLDALGKPRIATIRVRIFSDENTLFSNLVAGAVDLSPDLALRDAFRKMRHFMMTTRKLSEDEAISLMSVAVDFGVTQVVDGNWGVHAIIKKNLFSGA